MVFSLVFLTSVIISTKGVSQPKIRAAGDSVADPVDRNFPKFDIDKWVFPIGEKP